MLYGFAVILVFWFGWFSYPQHETPAVDGKTIAEHEEILHRILTYEEYAEQRKQLCGITFEIRDQETDLVLFTRCTVKGEKFSLVYNASGLILTVIEEDGSTMSDWGEDGEIDLAETRDNKRVYRSKKCPPATSDEHKPGWQLRFNERIESIFHKNPSLLQLGFLFI